MLKICFFTFSIVFASVTATQAQQYAVADKTSSPQIESVMIEGGPVLSKHFQTGKVNANQRHYLGIAQVSTKDYGNWGLYYLGPNSEDRTSVGIGYITDPYTVPLGPTKLELTGAIGGVTGYEYAVVPLLAAHARLVMYDNGKFDAGLAMAAMPYIMEDRQGKNKLGIVATIPFLSLRYKF